MKLSIIRTWSLTDRVQVKGSGLRGTVIRSGVNPIVKIDHTHENFKISGRRLQPLDWKADLVKSAKKSLKRSLNKLQKFIQNF